MAPGGKIDAFLDCVSPYSYFALLYLKKNQKALNSYNVDFELHPIFLGGVNVGSGNKPPWTLPAKANYSKFDSQRAMQYFNTPNMKTPDFFPILSLLPQRCMVYIKEAYSKAKFEDSFQSLWVAMWEQGKDLSKPQTMVETLSMHFSDDEVKKIMEAANSAKYKQILLDNTQKALDGGAFGAPWFLVTNFKGDREPFFGSDRFHYMWEYLGLPWTDIQLRENGKAML